MFRACFCMLLIAAPFGAQDKDFLTEAEVEQLREAQDLAGRFQLYLKFAEQRLDRLDSSFKNEKAGRSSLIHDLLDQFGKIIEAIDYNAEDALRHNRALDSITTVGEAEKKMLARLEAYKEAQPKDIARYQFVLDNAIDTTRDSIEINTQDVNERKRSVLERAQQETKEREAMTAKEGAAKESKAEPAKETAATKSGDTKSTRKPPTLYKKGEKPPDKNDEKK